MGVEIIMKSINRYNLEFDKTFSYFVDHIQSGKFLAKQAVTKIILNQGSFFTLLPSDAQLEKMYEFSCGGIMPKEPYGSRVYHIQGVQGDFHPQQVLTADCACSELVVNYLKMNLKNCAIIENYMVKPNSLRARIENVKNTAYKDELYYFLDRANSLRETYETIRKCSHSWHFFAILTNFKKQILDHLEVSDIELLCENLNFVIAGAYDGEGYVFWERK